MNGTSLRDGPVVIRAGTRVRDADVVVTPRIGITKAADWPLRYFVRDDPFVSRDAAVSSRARLRRSPDAGRAARGVADGSPGCNDWCQRARSIELPTL